MGGWAWDGMGWDGWIMFSLCYFSAPNWAWFVGGEDGMFVMGLLSSVLGNVDFDGPDSIVWSGGVAGFDGWMCIVMMMVVVMVVMVVVVVVVVVISSASK
ncbi:hypothetical protein GGS21DRAFT_496727 [Xylaria nigripes]|nr:hypothetical protein GGS21DRAFT_496727 [Xylaria nigripes]